MERCILITDTMEELTTSIEEFESRGWSPVGEVNTSAEISAAVEGDELPPHIIYKGGFAMLMVRRGRSIWVALKDAIQEAMPGGTQVWDYGDLGPDSAP